MSSTLLRIAREHNSVVAVVGKGHLQGINKHWKQPVVVGESFLSKFYKLELIFIINPNYKNSPCTPSNMGNLTPYPLIASLIYFLEQFAFPLMVSYHVS